MMRTASVSRSPSSSCLHVCMLLAPLDQRSTHVALLTGPLNTATTVITIKSEKNVEK